MYCARKDPTMLPLPSIKDPYTVSPMMVDVDVVLVMFGEFLKNHPRLFFFPLFCDEHDMFASKSSAIVGSLLLCRSKMGVFSILNYDDDIQANFLISPAPSPTCYFSVCALCFVEMRGID